MKIGDKFRVSATYPAKNDVGFGLRNAEGQSIIGAVGTVVDVGNPRRPGLSFKGITVGHSAVGAVTDKSAWFVETEYLQSVDVASDVTLSELFPADAKARKEIPLASGVLDYFTSALIEVAKVSFEGNKQHNPGEPLHWARGKSTDQADTLLRHFVERGTLDTDGVRHSAKLAWRALALLQLELEAAGAPLARGAK